MGSPQSSTGFRRNDSCRWRLTDGRHGADSGGVASCRRTPAIAGERWGTDDLRDARGGRQADSSSASINSMNRLPHRNTRARAGTGRPRTKTRSMLGTGNARFKEPPSGPLRGRRIAIKDNVCVAGMPMMNGSAVLEGFVPEADATVVERILDAGGEIAGKAVCESFCLSGGSHTADTGPHPQSAPARLVVRRFVERQCRAWWPVAKWTWPSAPTRRGRSGCPLPGAASLG